MKSKFIDIIVPLYNTNLDVFKLCVESIKNQTCKDFNLIIVNDGSTDKELLEYYKELKSDDFDILKIDNEKNIGLFNTRITGIKNSCSHFIQMVDSDDTINSKTIEILKNKFNENPNIDVFSFEYNHINSEKEKHINFWDFYGKCENDKYIDEDNRTGFGNYFYFITIRKKINTYIWTKCIKREVYINALKGFNLDDVNIYLYEDKFFNIIASIYSKSILCFKDKLYNYNLRSGESHNWIINSIEEFRKKTNYVYTIKYYEEILKSSDELKCIPNIKISSFIKTEKDFLIYYIKKLIKDKYTENNQKLGKEFIRYYNENYKSLLGDYELKEQEFINLN